jgi:SpoU rRNA methylase family enzyme
MVCGQNSMNNNMAKISNNQTVIFLAAAVFAGIVGFQVQLSAQAPGVGYVYPPFVQQGTSTSVRLGGYDFTPDLQIMVHSAAVSLRDVGPLGPFLVPPRPYWEGPRIFATALPIPREIEAVLSPDKTCALGRVSWQIVNANGVSKRGLFYVSDMVEQVESRFRSQSMELGSMPVAVSGRIRRLTEKDDYGFVATNTGQASLQVFARRVGSDFYAAVEVYGPDNVKIVDEVDTEGRDLDVNFAVETGERYRVVIHDSDFRGASQFVYRLLIEQVAMDSADQPPESVDRRRLDGPSDRQTFKVITGREYQVRAVSLLLGGDLDVALKVVDGEAKLIAENDDVTSETLDAEVRFVAKIDGELIAVVTGSSITGQDEDLFYELQVVELGRGFELITAPTAIAAVGEKASIAVTLIPAGGFSEEVQLKVLGLPEGVTVEGNPVIASGKKKGTVVLQIADNAAVKGTVIQVVGMSVVDVDKNLSALTVTANAVGGGSLASRSKNENLIDNLVLGVKLKAPFKLHVIDKDRQRVVHRGTTYPAPLQVLRDDGYVGVVHIMMKSQQGRYRMGIWGPIVDVGAEITDVAYPCFMPEWLATDRTSRMVVLGFGEVIDPQGQVRYVGVAADARITMILEGALLKVTPLQVELAGVPGQLIELPVKIVRSSKLQTAVTIDLELDDELAELLEYEPLILGVNQTEGVLKVQSLNSRLLRGIIPFTIRATTLQFGNLPVKSVQDYDVFFSTNIQK